MIWMKVDVRNKELPLEIADTAAELARRLQEQELLTPLREGGVCLRASAPASLPLLCSLLQVR
jgi:hypothetical protein